MVTIKTITGFGYSATEAGYFMRRIKDSFGIKVHNVREDSGDRINFTEAVAIGDVIQYLEQYILLLKMQKTGKPKKWIRLLNELKRVELIKV